jgi:hypothetical protein
VYPNKKRWQANICYDRKTHHLGYFDTKQEAAFVYDRAARQRGEVNLLNYENIEAAEEASAKAKAEHTISHPQQPKPRPASGYYGVYAKGKRWAAQICYSSKEHGLGSFDTKQEAALAFDRAARQCGENKSLNYESIKAAEEAVAKAQAEYALVHLCVGPKQPRPRPPSGFYGVCAVRKRWKAQISNGGKYHHLGTFDTKEEAALAYDRKAREFGEGKPLNYGGCIDRQLNYGGTAV